MSSFTAIHTVCVHVVVYVHFAKLFVSSQSIKSMFSFIHNFFMSFASLARKSLYFVSRPRVGQDTGHYAQYQDCFDGVGMVGQSDF